jgi:hypothetical protein
MKVKLTGAEVDLMLESIEEKQLLKWFNKWKDSPWLYATTMFLKKLPVYILIAMVFSFQKLKSLINHPIAYFEQQGIFILIIVIVFIVSYRIHWNRKAVKYYFFSRINERLPKVELDQLIAIKGRKVKDTSAAKFEKWGDKKLLLQTVLGLLLPLAFFLILYISNAISDDNWDFNNFTNGFESKSLIVLIFATFMLFGILLEYSLWRQVKDDYLLLNKAKFNR